VQLQGVEHQDDEASLAKIDQVVTCFNVSNLSSGHLDRSARMVAVFLRPCISGFDMKGSPWHCHPSPCRSVVTLHCVQQFYCLSPCMLSLVFRSQANSPNRPIPILRNTSCTKLWPSCACPPGPSTLRHSPRVEEGWLTTSPPPQHPCFGIADVVVQALHGQNPNSNPRP
jgi:hypothetical protein